MCIELTAINHIFMNSKLVGHGHVNALPSNQSTQTDDYLPRHCELVLLQLWKNTAV
jgi:hypothetical protein